MHMDTSVLDIKFGLFLSRFLSCLELDLVSVLKLSSFLINFSSN